MDSETVAARNSFFHSHRSAKLVQWVKFGRAKTLSALFVNSARGKSTFLLNKKAESPIPYLSGTDECAAHYLLPSQLGLSRFTRGRWNLGRILIQLNGDDGAICMGGETSARLI